MPSGDKQGFAEHNSNWKPDTTSEGTGRIRAYRWYPEQPCEICGGLGEHHHRDGNTLNNEPFNIRFLCRKHHMEIDGRLSRFIEARKQRGRI